MKKAFKNLFSALIFALVSVSAHAESPDKTVNFLTDPEKEGGFLIEISQAAFRRVGYTVNIQFMPWARALESVKGGHAEALLGAYHTDERAEKMLYTDRIGTSELVFFKLKSAGIAYSRLEDLRPYSVGTITGASYTPEFDRAVFIEKHAVSDYNINIRKLLAGRIDLIVEKKAVILNALTTRFPEAADKIVALDRPLTTGAFFNAFSKKIPGYERKVADFNKGLSMIASDGTLKKILDKNLHE